MITFTRTIFSNPDFRNFIVALDNEYVVRYPFMAGISNPFNIMDERARVMLAYDNEMPVACGAFRPVDEKTIEVKRMYTLPQSRNQGIGKRVLRELENWAREQGYSVSILETGINQPEAIAAYEKSGYVRIPKFPPYVNVNESICMQKSL